MKKILLFYLEDCPYCHNARRALKELAAEKADYGEVEVEWIEESRQPQVAQQYDYYYVPTIFAGKTKLYEAHPAESYEDCRQNIKAALEAVLSKESGEQ